MGMDFKVPWEKYATISYLAKAMEHYDVQFGKTSLQKIVYILQEVYNIEIGYPYALYNYGPYSANLASDLDYIAALKGVEVSWVNTGGYSIKPDVEADAFINKSQTFIDSNKVKINEALENFGGFTAKELELRATIIYFVKEYGKQHEEEIFGKIHELKPYFSMEKIQDTFYELKSKKII